LTPKIIAIVGSSTAIDRQRLRILDGRDRVADVDVLDAGERDDLAEARAIDGSRLRPSKTYNCDTFVLCTERSGLTTAI
jgi:hypothetical protein